MMLIARTIPNWTGSIPAWHTAVIGDGIAMIKMVIPSMMRPRMSRMMLMIKYSCHALKAVVLIRATTFAAACSTARVQPMGDAAVTMIAMAPAVTAESRKIPGS